MLMFLSRASRRPEPYVARYEVIEAKRWEGPDGRTASIYGACPWAHESERVHWRIVSVGWTLRDHFNNTVGLGRKPFANRTEAEWHARRLNQAQKSARKCKSPRLRALPGQKEQEMTKYLGHCQVCEGFFHIDAYGKMVNHGFRRPGDGTLRGRCPAVGQLPYENSCDFLRDTYLPSLCEARKAHESKLTQLRADEVEEFYVLLRQYRPGKGWVHEEVRVDRTHQNFERHRQRKTSECETEVKHLQFDISRLEKRIAGWVKADLVPAQEVEAAADEAKKVKAQAAHAARVAKLEAQIVKYCERIDRAVKRHTLTTLADIFENAPIKIRELCRDFKERPTHEQALKMLNRNHVWCAFGLTTEEGRFTPEVAKIRGDMRYTRPYNWPEGL